MGEMTVEWLTPPYSFRAHGFQVSSPRNPVLQQKPNYFSQVSTQIPKRQETKESHAHLLFYFLGFSAIISKKITEESFKLYFQSIPLTSPLIFKNQENTPLKFALPSVLKKKTHTLVNPRSYFLYTPSCISKAYYNTDFTPSRHVVRLC